MKDEAPVRSSGAGAAHGGADPRSPGAHVEALVFAERVALLHTRALVAQATVLVNAALVTAVFWGRSPRVPSLLWLSALCALAVGRALVAALAPGSVRTLEDRRVRQPSRAVELGVAVRDFEGRAYVLVVARDVSARKEMEQRLAQAGLLASVGSLAAGLAHEINNPLAYIVANLGHLRARIAESAGMHAAEKAELAEVIEDSLDGASRVRRIVRDLGALSPRAHEQVEPIDVHAALESCVNVAMSEIRHRATLVAELEDVPPVSGDRTRVGQVLLNLLVNAAEAIPEGDAASHQITVRTRFDPAAAMVHVDVADTGVGIPAAHLERVFEPFFTTKRVGLGRRLGLSICHRIVTGLGGRISARSREGEGSTFTVSLPAALR